jgi:hypothetical protein
MKQTDTHFRTTVYIEEKTHEKLKKYREETGISLAHSIRKGIKLFMESPEFKKSERERKEEE